MLIFISPKLWPLTFRLRIYTTHKCRRCWLNAFEIVSTESLVKPLNFWVSIWHCQTGKRAFGWKLNFWDFNININLLYKLTHFLFPPQIRLYLTWKRQSSKIISNHFDCRDLIRRSQVKTIFYIQHLAFPQRCQFQMIKPLSFGSFSHSRKNSFDLNLVECRGNLNDVQKTRSFRCSRKCLRQKNWNSEFLTTCSFWIGYIRI